MRAIDVEELEIRNPLFLGNMEVTSLSGTDTIDTGLVNKYYNGSNLVYTGLFRDATDATYKLFDSLQVLPTVDTGFVNTAGAGYNRASLDLQNLHAFGNVIIDGDLSVLGNTVVISVSNLTVEDNIIVANAGPANVKEDAGFVVRRPVSAVITDTPKETGTASAAGTTTTITLQAANGHGSTLNYYVGWVISLAGNVTGSAVVTASTAANPPVLTFDTAATGSTSVATTYELFNKQYVGTIWDESTDKVTFYGFPRENVMGVIDPAGDAGNGNLAEYIDTRARDMYVDRDLYVQGVIKASARFDDNIIAVNGGPTNSEDSGFVVTRTPARVALDTPLQSGTASAAGTTTTVTLQAANGHGATLNFYRGWVIKFGGDVTGTATVLSNTAASPPVLTFSVAASGATTVSSTYELFNKTYVGTIYDESTDTYMTVGFPREISEGVIDPVSPVNGNVPSYVNVAFNDVYVNGAITFANGNLLNTITQVGATTFTANQILRNDIIYLNPSADTTYTLSTVAALALAANKSKTTMFVNIGSFVATIAAGAANTIEGLATLRLTKLYSKTVLTGSSELATVWTIKG